MVDIITIEPTCPPDAVDLPSNNPPVASGTGGSTPIILIDTLGLTTTLTAGVYTRAAILALFAPVATRILEIQFVVHAGTADVAQTGSIQNLAVGEQWVKNYLQNYSVNDFTITVDAGSEIFLQARGLA